MVAHVEKEGPARPEGGDHPGADVSDKTPIRKVQKIPSWLGFCWYHYSNHMLLVMDGDVRISSMVNQDTRLSWTALKTVNCIIIRLIRQNFTT